MTRSSPSYVGLRPSSERASKAARGASKKADTVCEVMLRSELFRRGLRFRKNVRGLPGVPDIVFVRQRVAVFCDGDFWHGRDWNARRAKLATGANSAYWHAKIERNMARDAEQTAGLTALGWTVVRVWETDVRKDVAAAATRIQMVVDARPRTQPRERDQEARTAAR